MAELDAALGEDTYRAELVHKWRMKRVHEVIAAVHQETIILERDIQWVESIQEAMRRE